MKKELKSHNRYKAIVEELYPNENFRYYETFESDDHIYLFFYHHKLIYPLSHDLHWNLLDRGPIVIHKKTAKYEALEPIGEKLGNSCKAVENGRI